MVAETAPTLTQLATLGHSWIITPNLLFDEVLGFSRMGQHGTDSFFGTNVGLELGIPGTNGPDIRQSGFPIFNITGFSSLGQTANYSPFWRNDQTWTNSHNLTWTHGAHEFRFGFDMIRFQLNQWQPEAGNFGPRGLFTFDGAVTGLNGGQIAESIQCVCRVFARPRSIGRQNVAESISDGPRMAVWLVWQGSLAGYSKTHARPWIEIRTVSTRSAHQLGSGPFRPGDR